MRLDPSQPGRNTVTVSLLGAGSPVDPAAPPVLVVRGPERDLGQVPVERVSAGRYRAVVLLPDPGRWLVRVRVRLPSGDLATQRLAFLVVAAPPR